MRFSFGKIKLYAILRFSSICCCAGGSVETSGCARMRRVRPVTNRVLPVTSAGEMVDNRREDYLEVRPQRTVRVVHAMPNVKQKKRRRKRKMRTGETQSRHDELIIFSIFKNIFE